MEESVLEQGQLQSLYTRYLPFLTEIRRRLLFIVSLFLISGVLGFFYNEKIVSFVLKFFKLEGVNIVFTSPFQFFNLAISSGFLVGVVVVFPVLIYQLLSFLKPALSKHEYKTIIALSPISIFLFLVGFGFGVITMRYVVTLFYEKSVGLSIGNFLDVTNLLSQILMTSILMGLAFQFPVILTILMKLRILKYRTVVKQRFLVYIISVVFATLLPPTDLLSLVLLTLPLIFLYELSLILNRWILKTHLM